jgi:hypothetical protein
VSRLHLTIITAGIALFAGVLVFGYAHSGPGATPATSTTETDRSSALTESYTDPAYGFSFEFPAGLLIDTVKNEAGYVLLAEKPNTKHGFQVFVSSFPHDAVLNAKTIERELPLDIIGPIQEISLPDGTAAFRLFAKNLELGSTLEVLFRRGSALYQVTSYPESSEWLDRIMSTWRFSP